MVKTSDTNLVKKTNKEKIKVIKKISEKQNHKLSGRDPSDIADVVKDAIKGHFPFKWFEYRESEDIGRLVNLVVEEDEQFRAYVERLSTETVENQMVNVLIQSLIPYASSFESFDIDVQPDHIEIVHYKR